MAKGKWAHEQRAKVEMGEDWMSYEEWVEQMPEAIKKDAPWRFDAYRKALYMYDLVWPDCDLLMRDVRGREVTRQLIRASGSISANMEEGYGRGYSKDRDYFLRIALGSGRETRGWYVRSRHLLSAEVLDHRINLASEIIALLVTEISKKRRAH